MRRAFALAMLLLASNGCDSKPAPVAAPGATTASTASAGVEAGPNADVAYSRELTGRYAAALKQELMGAMNAGGPVKAIEVCSDKAPTIGGQIGIREGWSIRRTSLQLRNPKNEPDAWEKGVLERFARDKARGVPIDKLEAHEVVVTGGSRELRYMKAIGTAALCLSCHGADLPQDVAAAVAKRYPDDKARGFAEGDLRGAFSVRRRL